MRRNLCINKASRDGLITYHDIYLPVYEEYYHEGKEKRAKISYRRKEEVKKDLQAMTDNNTIDDDDDDTKREQAQLTKEEEDEQELDRFMQSISDKVSRDYPLASNEEKELRYFSTVYDVLFVLDKK